MAEQERSQTEGDEQGQQWREEIARSRKRRKSREEINADQRRRAEARKAKGQCVSCTRPAVPGKVFCQHHADKSNAQQQERRKRGIPKERRETLNAGQMRRYKEHKANGLCGFCNYPAVPGLTTCERHRQVNNERSALKRRRGTCSCGKPARLGRTTCAGCRVKNREWIRANMARLFAAGLCVYCGNCPPEPKRKGCRGCLLARADWALQRHAVRLAQGLCALCAKGPHLPCQTCCEVCLLKRLSHGVFGTGRRWEELHALFERQGRRCVYTGRALTLGADAELDHRVASSRGGSNDLSNLQWVHTSVNQMKWTYTEEEFFSLVADVYRHRIAPAT